MSKYNMTCDNCGKVEHVLIDGYCFDDRLLEDVEFEVRVVNDKVKVVVEESAKPYFETLNEKLWLKRAKEFAEETDIVECPYCHNQMLFATELKPRSIRKIVKTLKI